MDYRLLVDIKKGWKDISNESVENVARAATYKILHYAHMSAYPAEEVGAYPLLKQACDAIGITPTEIENLGFNWKASLSHIPSVGAEWQPDVSPLIVERLYRRVLENRDFHYQYKHAKGLIRVHHSGKILNPSFGAFFGITAGFFATAFYEQFLSLAAILSLDAAAGAVSGLATFAISKAIFTERKNDAYYKMEVSAKPAIYRGWIAAAAESGYSKIRIKNLYSFGDEGKIELSSDTKADVRHLIDHALDTEIGKDGGWGFGIELYPANPELSTNYINLYAARSWDQILPPRPGKNKKREELNDSRWDWLPEPQGAR